MILVDTSIWIDHLRIGDADLAALLDGGLVLAHPFVIGELALGGLHDRVTVLHALRLLPRAQAATDDEVLQMIEGQSLWGLGIGYVDAHLLAATRLTPGATIWTRDARLAAAAETLGVSAP
jgi:predicted nucleic acid-binding protein